VVQFRAALLPETHALLNFNLGSSTIRPNATESQVLPCCGNVSSTYIDILQSYSEL
jgi:hypothetical protein